MKKKYITLLFLIGLLLPTLTPTICAKPTPEILLDQHSPLGSASSICGAYNNYIAQSFKPTLPNLAYVKIGMFRQYNATGTVTISIRERLNGKDLTKITLPTEKVPTKDNPDWVLFDLPDITLKTTRRYFILYTMNDGNRPESEFAFWIHSNRNPYHSGRPWQYTSFGFWLPTLLLMTFYPDTSFQTYGYTN